jgi:hypothetical protein
MHEVVFIAIWLYNLNKDTKAISSSRRSTFSDVFESIAWEAINRCWVELIGDKTKEIIK